MTDRELLEAAARAAGLDGVWWEMYPGDWWLDMPPKGPDLPRQVWRPLTDDGDALRLAVKLGMHIRLYEDECNAIIWGHGADATEPVTHDPCAAARRAIVRAAAALAK